MAQPLLPPTVDPPCSFWGRWDVRTRRHLIEPLAIFLISVGGWAVYRYFWINYTNTTFGEPLFFAGQIFAQPTIWLGPSLVYWFVFRKGEGSYFTITRERAAQVTLVAVLFVSLYYILFEQMMYGIDSQAVNTTQAAYVVTWVDLTPFEFFMMTFTFFFIVGPVEELFNRGFLLGQFSKVLAPWQAVLLSAFCFAAGHWPINILLYHWTVEQIAIMSLYYTGFGVLMGMFYLWSRNLLGAIIFHGFWDWVLSIYTYAYASEVVTSSDLTDAFIRLIVVEWTLVALFLVMFYALYRTVWQEEWQDSWGLMASHAPTPGKYPYVSESGSDHWTDPGVRRDIIAFYGRHHPEKALGWRLDSRGRGSSLTTTAVSVFMITALLCGMTMGVSGTSYITYAEYAEQYLGLSDDGGYGDFGEEMSNSTTFSQYGDENTEVALSLDLPSGSRLTELQLTLEWEDEPDMRGGIRYHNQPDSFGLRLELPDGTNQSTPATDSGRAVLTWSAGEDDMVIVESGVSLVVVVGECGDQEPIIGLLLYNDNGNDFTLTVNYSYQEPA